MPKGHCILFISTVGAFYSRLYNLEKHPNYKNLYEPWSKKVDNLYEHEKELESQNDYKLLSDLGLEFAKPIKSVKIETADKQEIKQITKYGIKLEDF